jgi:transcriptional regulator with XRE-family HTH domain
VTTPRVERSRSPLGALMVVARAERGLSLRGLAAALDAAPTHVCDLETGRRLPSAAMLSDVLRALDVPRAERDRWYAAAQTFPPGMLDALFAAPERWGDVRALLAGGGR